MHRQQGISSFHRGPSGAIPNLPGHYLAQVIGLVPKEHAVNIILPSLSTLNHSADRGGMKVSVMARRAGNFIGEIDLPRIGDWGVVVFLQGSHQYAVWLGSLYQTYAGLATEPAGTRVNQHDSGVYERIDLAGNVEWSHPSGTYLRIGTGTALTGRTRKQRKAKTPASETVAYAIPTKATPTVYLNHPSGTTVTIEPSGKVTINSADEVAVDSTGKVVVHSTDKVSVYGDTATHAGAEAGVDFLVMKAAIDQILTTFNAHVHGGGNPPSTPLAAWVPDVHHTSNLKAT